MWRNGPRAVEVTNTSYSALSNTLVVLVPINLFQLPIVFPVTTHTEQWQRAQAEEVISRHASSLDKGIKIAPNFPKLFSLLFFLEDLGFIRFPSDTPVANTQTERGNSSSVKYTARLLLLRFAKKQKKSYTQKVRFASLRKPDCTVFWGTATENAHLVLRVKRKKDSKISRKRVLRVLDGFRTIYSYKENNMNVRVCGAVSTRKTNKHSSYASGPTHIGSHTPPLLAAMLLLLFQTRAVTRFHTAHDCLKR